MSAPVFVTLPSTVEDVKILVRADATVGIYPLADGTGCQLVTAGANFSTSLTLEQVADELYRALSGDELGNAIQTPLLGLATTDDLLDELQARGNVLFAAGPTDQRPYGQQIAATVSNLRAALPDEVLNYRTSGDF